MSKSVWLNGTYLTDVAADRNLPVFGPRNWTHPNYYTLMPCAGSVNLLRGQISAAPSVGESRIITLYKNDGVTGLQAQFDATDVVASDMADIISVAAGDRLNLRATASGGVAAAYLRYSLQFNSTTAKQSVLSGLCTGLSQTDILYMPLSGEGSALSATNKLSSLVMPCAGTIKNLYVWLSAAPGGAFPNARRRKFTVSLNGVNQTLTKTIIGANTTGSDTTHSFAVVAGDYICVECEPIADNGNPPDMSNASVSVVFESTNEGEFVVPVAGAGGWMPQATNKYAQICSGLALWLATEDEAYGLSQAIKFTRLQVLLSAGVGVGSYRFALKQNGTTTTLDVTIAAGDNGFDTGIVITANDDLVDFLVNPVGNPVKNTAVVSLLAKVWHAPRLLSTF